MSASPYFHSDSDSVRFTVVIGEVRVGASVGRLALHHRFCPAMSDDDALQTYLRHASDIDEAVRRRIAEGAREPVMLREFDLRRNPG